MGPLLMHVLWDGTDQELTFNTIDASLTSTWIFICSPIPQDPVCIGEKQTLWYRCCPSSLADVLVEA